MPSFNVPDDEKPSFNKKVKESLDILSKDVDGTLNRLRSFQPETLVESYNSPNEDPSVRDLSPLEQYFYEPQPVAEVADLTAMPQQESMVVPQDQPKVLSNLVNQYESVSNQDMVSVTPYGQEALDAFGSYADSLRDESGKVVGSALDVFAQPLDENKVKALGYVDNDMRPTEKGELFYNLVNAGMFNDNGTITEKGQAYMTPTRDVGKPENLKAFKILWDDEVIRSNASWGEIGAGTVNLLKDAAFGAGERLGQEAQSLLANSQTWGAFMGFEDLRPQQLRDEMTASGLGIAEGAVENIASYKGLAQIASAFVGKGIYSILPVGMDDEADQALYEARQRQWQTQEDMQNLGAGEIAETVLGINGAVKAAQEAKTVLGETEFEKRYGKAKAFSQFVDPVNLIPIGAAVNAAKAAPLASRIAITAQRRLGKIAAQDFLIANATTAIEAGNSVLKKEALTYSMANRLSSEIAQRAVNNPELIARSNQAAQVASRITEEANKIRTALPTLTDDLAKMVAKRNSMATRIPETYYKKVLGTMELGRQLRSMPAKKIGAAFERVGETISKTDNAVSNFLQERGLDQMYTAAVGAAGIVGLAGNPVIGAIGAGAAILKTGKVLSNYGKLFRYVGKEMENARGQIPFWKRVARHTEPGSLNRGIAHTFNTFDLGGATSDILRRTGRGVLAAAPSDLMFEYLSDGADMRPETFYQAASESLVLGGSFAAGGGAFMGTKKRMRELSIGDELNFRRDMTDPRQKVLFESIPSSTRRAIATYSIANPTLNYVFKDSGASRYDINSNTAIINVNSTNPIKALVAHETLHHTIIKNNMESGISALFLGDTKTNTVGGLFRSKDGKLDPNFEAFKNGYYKRLGIDDMPNAERDAIYPLEKIAVEYFIEKHADQYAEMAESGKLGAVSASGAVKRKMSSILETVLPRIPVLKDLHFKSGGMINANGSWVTGNGILDSEGVKRDPLTSRMFRDMNRRSSGLAPGQFNPLMSDNEDSGASIFLDPANEIDAELLHPQVKVDEDGKPIRQNGQLVAIDKSTELSRALAGLTAIEVLRRKREANYAPEKGEAYVNDEGEFQPGWLSTDVITEMFAKNNYNPEQKRIIREVNRLIRKGSGDRMVMVNFPATGRNKAGKVVYKPQKATLRDTVPVAVTVSKDGNLLIGLMSVTKLQENISKRAQSKRGKKLYSGNIDLILQDTQAMMDFHKSGTDSIEYFKARYGAVEADERKKFINTMFGLLNQKEQAVLNPILLEDGVKSRDNVYRTYRADRVSKAVAMSPEDYPSMPFNYEAVSQVKMPEQTRLMPDKKLQIEITQLQDQIDRMYESGRTDGVEDLEEKLETLLEKSETDMAAMQMESMQEFDDANPSQEEALVTSWYRWTGKGLPDESADLKRDYGTFGAFVRASQGDMIGKVKDIGTLNENISDKQIEDAAKESAAAYERRRDALKSSARDRNVTKAVNINDGGKQKQDFTGQILRGEKTIETRDALNNALQPLLGQRIGLASTGKGKGTTRIVGYATVGDQPIVYNTEAEFRKDEGKHLVSQGSEYDIKQGQKKYGYELKDVVAVKPFVPKSTNRKYSVIDPLTLSRLPEPLRQMPENIPVAKTTPEVLEETKSKELRSTGIDIPESIDSQSVISNAIQIANSQSWKKGRDFKLDLQRRVLEAAEKAGVNISERTLESIEYLVRVGLKDALIALEQNPNAIGWYDEKTKQALGVMSLLFPEIATDENARFAFTWALAVTSNGLKVDKNFELAERVYRQYRETGKMPTDIKAGQAQKAINKSLDLFNQLTDEWGINNTRQFMQTEFTVGEISRLGVVSKADKKEVKPGGEHSDTIVRGSAILGPKIGNGFFSNLYGLFDALTMDRWLVRTWGRWTGTLVEFNPELTQKAKTRLEETLAQLTPDDKSRMDQAIGKDVSSMTTEDLAFAIQKASMKPKLREVMNATATGEEFRMAGNGLAKYLDGQKEAPANPAERNFIREIFGLVLDELKSDAKYADLTMADLQAVLWYAEKRLYETAKVKADQDAIDSSDADGYEDDEAPDYANAAIGVARKNGVSSKRINEVLEKIKNDNATITQPSDEGRSDAETKQQESAGGFAGKQKQKFKQYIAVTTTRRNRSGNEKALWSYQTKSGVNSSNAGVLKSRSKKNLGIKYVSELNPGRKLKTIFKNNNLPVVNFLQLDSTDAVSAQKFADTIQKSKDGSPHGAAVYVYPSEEYQGMKLFLSDSGKSGFAVKPDGDIVSVFSMEKGSGRSIMEAAISAGGKKLDAFDTVLPEFYGTHGFVEASRMLWNDEFMPDGWDKQAFKEFNNGEPDVVMMVLDPNFEGEYTPRKDIYTTDYDQAIEMQNNLIKKVNRGKSTISSQLNPKKTIKKSQAKGDSSAIAKAANLK